MFVTAAQLKSRVADVLRQSQGAAQLISNWEGIVQDACRAAYGDIAAALAGRGFTQAQLAAWDQGYDFQMAIGLYYALETAAAAGKVPPDDADAIAKLDRRAELATVPVLNGGVLVEPGVDEAGAGPIGFGPTRNRTDRHTMHGDGVIPGRVREESWPWR
jgi:hypothetical protein